MAVCAKCSNSQETGNRCFKCGASMISQGYSLPPVPQTGRVERKSDDANGQNVLDINLQFSKVRVLDKIKLIWIFGSTCLSVNFIFTLIANFFADGPIIGIFKIFSDTAVFTVQLIIWRGLCEVVSIWYSKNK